MNGKTEQIIPWENEDGEYYVFFPGYADLSKAQIKLNTTDTVLLNGKALREDICCEVFQLNVPYEIAFQAWGKEQIHQLMFVRSANIATMYIDTKSGSMDYIHAEKGNEETGKIRLYTADGELDYDGELEAINGRGNSTWTISEKKPYSMSLTEEANLLEMGAAHEWTLLANAYDPSNMRNKMVYDFADELGLQYSPDSQWVDVYLNGKYAGLYLLCERNEVHSQRVAISTKGSFLVSAERESRLIDQNLQYVLTEAGQALRMHYMDANVDMAEIMQSVENAILSADGTDPISGKSWMELIDVESWARKYLIEEFFANTDGGALSQFYYYDGADLSGKVYAGPVWDFDASSGAAVSWQIPFTDIFYANRPMIREGEEIPWFYSLYQKEAFINRAIEIYEIEFLPLVQRLLEKDINEYAAFIASSARMNDMRWSAEQAFDQAVEELNSFLKERIRFLSELWSGSKVYHTVSIYPGLDVHHVYCPVELGGLLMPLPQLQGDENFNFLGWYYVDTDLPFDSTAPITEDIEIYAKWEDSGSKRLGQIAKLMPLAVIACMGVGVLWADIRRSRKGG